MPLQERLNELMSVLRANNVQIAHYAGFDRTNLSRLRNGSRVPQRSGPTAEKLVSGLYLFADNRNELGMLCAAIGANADAPADKIKAALSAWLWEGQEPTPPSRKRAAAAAEYRSFGEKLNVVMTLAEVSNVRLSRLVNVDASLISRFRTGVRTPRSNPELAERLCLALLLRLRALGKLRELSRITKLEDPDEESFRDWLCDFGEGDTGDFSAVERLLEGFDTFPASPAPPASESLPELREDSRTVYYGRAGLRQAVIRFLSSALRSGAKELWLYSDQNMEWMVGDPVFHARWGGLMRACVENGIRIRVIHNIDRELGEMISAIQSWLPLYLTGMIEPYTCRKRNRERFAHTLFLCPGLACIEAFHVFGTEDTGVYHYHTDARTVAVFESAYERLLESTQPLLRFPCDGEQEPGTGGLTVLQNTLSLATMPEALAESFHSPALRQKWERERAQYQERLRSAFVYECIPSAPDEALFSGQVPVEQLPDAPPLYYTPDQYSAHIANIIHLSERYANYRFYVLPEAPFPTVKLMIGNHSVTVTRTRTPFLSFQFTHPLMCSAFQGYARCLMEQYKVDRNTLRRELGRYLS